MAAEPNTEPTRPLPEEEQEEFEDGEESDEYDVDVSTTPNPRQPFLCPTAPTYWRPTDVT
ncbi:hypothetical protein PISMIDRAFT_671940 [Pisolithus microcarpus 441]|uniref:Uncharacterized protein n=1 Tax=Pisolithus microcarpus 441 TaxID=765257 RepID=A0A0D0AD16_9AGAM|nr:hypothetical protein PISMIDRAFT_671940 [Pisolithus microcarpus 441]